MLRLYRLGLATVASLRFLPSAPAILTGESYQEPDRTSDGPGQAAMVSELAGREASIAMRIASAVWFAPSLDSMLAR